MDIGKIEKVGDRELPGVPAMPQERPQTQPAPAEKPAAPAPAKQPAREKEHA